MTISLKKALAIGTAAGFIALAGQTALANEPSEAPKDKTHKEHYKEMHRQELTAADIASAKISIADAISKAQSVIKGTVVKAVLIKTKEGKLLYIVKSFDGDKKQAAAVDAITGEAKVKDMKEVKEKMKEMREKMKEKEKEDGDDDKEEKDDD